MLLVLAEIRYLNVSSPVLSKCFIVSTLSLAPLCFALPPQVTLTFTITDITTSQCMAPASPKFKTSQEVSAIIIDIQLPKRNIREHGDMSVN